MTPGYLLSFTATMTPQLEGVREVRMSMEQVTEGPLFAFDAILVDGSTKELLFGAAMARWVPLAVQLHFIQWLQDRGWAREFDPETGYAWKSELAP